MSDAQVADQMAVWHCVQVYAKLRILGADKPYGPTMGLLLKSDYHDAWDRYKWALYPDVRFRHPYHRLQVFRLR